MESKKKIHPKGSQAALPIKWTTKRVRISQLKVAKYNPRKISQMKAELLEKSIKEFNIVEIPVVNTDFTIIAGHQRIGVEEKLFGAEHEIEVRIPNRKLTTAEEKEYNVRSNKNKGEFDMVLMTEFIDVQSMEELGFEPVEMKHDEHYEPEVHTGLQDEFIKSAIKQIAFTFNADEFETNLNKLIAIQNKYGAADLSETFDKMLEHYEATLEN